MPNQVSVTPLEAGPAGPPNWNLASCFELGGRLLLLAVIVQSGV